MKRIASIFLIAVMVIACLPVAAFACGTANVSIGSATVDYSATDDQTVSISISISGDEHMVSWVSADVIADSPLSVTKVVGVMANKGHVEWAFTPMDDNGDEKYDYNELGAPSVSFTATVLIPAGTPAGTYNVGFDAGSFDVGDADINNYDYSGAVGVIEVVGPAHEHAWGEWEVTTPATCTEAGVETRTCANADCPIGTETREIPALGHTWGEWEVTKEATCVEAGVETRTCSVCGETETREIAMVDHNYSAWTFCGTDDKHEHEKVCSVCGDKVVAACNDKLQYTDEEKVEGGKNVTEYWQCVDCGHEFTNTKFVETPDVPVVDPDLDDVPRTDDITGQVVMAGVAALVCMMAAVAFIFKRKAAK